MSRKHLQSKRQGSRRVWKQSTAAILALLMVLSATGTEVFAGTGTVGTVTVEVSAPEIEVSQELMPTGDMTFDVELVSEEEVPADIPVYTNQVSYGSVETEINEDEYDSRYGYKSLSSSQKGFYDAILTAIDAYVNSDYLNVDITSDEDQTQIFGVDYSSYSLSLNDTIATYFCLRNDFPEFFWLPSGFSYTSSTLYISLVSDYYTAESRLATDYAISQGIAEYQAAVEGMTDTYEIVRTVHDKLITDVEYAYDSSGNPESSLWAHSIAGVFDEHAEVVCEGYAKTMQYVLNKLGIENVYMVGVAGGAHAWNGVLIDDKWFYLDATWDDTGSTGKGGGIKYLYFCIPATVFEKSHTVNTPSKKGTSWLYAIPTMSNSEDYTFYAKYGCDFTSVSSTSAAEEQLQLAGKLVPGDYVHALVTSASMSYVAGATGVTSAIVGPDGNYVMVIDATSYKVTNPATSLTLSKSTLEINRDESKTAELTATISASSGTCDDAIRWSSSDSCVTVTSSGTGTSAVLTAKRNGTATITATAVGGGIKATCNVTVTGSIEYENIYLDAACSETPDEEDFYIWVNGGNVGPTKDTKYNYKMRTLYTDVRPSTITTVDAKGRTKTTNGKLVVGITLSDSEPELVKGKIVDTEAAKIAKATVNAKTGEIKITAQKETGTVYLWVVDTGDDKAMAYAKITVKASPVKMVVNDADYTSEDRSLVKAVTLPLNESTQVYLEPLLATKSTTIADDSTYTVSYSKEGEQYVSVTPISGSKYGYTISPIGLNALKAGKTVKVTVTFTCNENGKKASVAVTLTNPTTAVTYSAGTGMTDTGNNAFTVPYSDTLAQTFTLNFTTEVANESFLTTDAVKLNKVSGPDGITFNEKGKMVIARPTGNATKIAATISKDKTSITIKIPKKLAAGTKAYFFLYYSNDCYEVFSIEVVE